ncbi:MAG TPA: helix-turn-helix domain-containing protein [Terriglobia bacterium]|nr:helix-turn-helix domain-containing protein [Terriglobia bacterium]
MTQKDRLELELAGLTDENGNVGGRVPANYVVVPEIIELKSATDYWNEETLVWKLYFGDPKTRPQVVQPDQDTLNEFVSLAEKPPEAFLEFARKWGVLNLSGPSKQGYIRPCTLSEKGEEPISAWRYYSRRAKAVLAIAARLRQGKPAPEEEWHRLRYRFEDDSPEHFHELIRYGLGAHPEPAIPFHFKKGSAAYRKEYLRRERESICSELNRWLALNNHLERKPDFQIQWNWDKDGWELRIDYDGFLFRALAWQLAIAACGSMGLYFCWGCGLPYLRTRHAPRRSKANFCERCGRAVINRQAAQRRRQKIARALALHSKGASVQEIAKKLDTTVEHVRNWIRTGKSRKEA